MKSIKTISSVLGAALLASCISSCDKLDYPDRFRQSEGVPVVYSVSYSATGVYIEQAFMEEIVCILGENLRSVHNVWFNDQEAVLNTSYMTDNTLLVQIPKTMPVVETDKIYLITAALDTVSYDFRVLPPAPRVSYMDFEYAEPGTVTTIRGNFFYEKEGGVPLTIEFPNATVTDIKEIALDHVTFTVPTGALPGKVKVTTASGTSASDFMYKDNRGMLIDFDNGLYSINKGWKPKELSTVGGFSGNYVILGNGSETLDADGSDWKESFQWQYWAGNWADPEPFEGIDGRRLLDIVDFSDYSSMVLKFEVNISSETPWTGTPMQIIFSSTAEVSNGATGAKDIYGNTLAGCNNHYFHDDGDFAGLSLPRYLWEPWKTSGSYDTNGEWRTITCPISEFTKYWDGSNASGKLTPESFSNLEIFISGGSSSCGTAGSSPIIKMDNFRAVPVR